MVSHTYNLRTWEAETGKLQVQGQPELSGKTLSQKTSQLANQPTNHPTNKQATKKIIILHNKMITNLGKKLVLFKN